MEEWAEGTIRETRSTGLGDFRTVNVARTSSSAAFSRRREAGLVRPGSRRSTIGPMGALDPELDHADLRAAYAEMRALAEGSAESLRALQPARSGWSGENHLAHACLANERVFANLKSLRAGQGLLIVRGGEPHPLARELLAAGRLPRGEAKAPRMVTPPARMEPGLLLQWLGEGQALLTTLDPATVVASELKIPHQLLGPLDAPEWLRFARVHTRHHLAIVGELLAP